MCAMEMMDERAPSLVRALERRIVKRMAEYEAANAAWKANRESWSELDGSALAARAAFRECMAESRRLNALCEKLHKQIRRLRQELWRAEREEEEVESGKCEVRGGESLATCLLSLTTPLKISPPGRAACAESGCPDDTVFTPLLQGEGGLRQRSEGNRVGMIQIRNPKSEIRNEEDGRAGA